VRFTGVSICNLPDQLGCRRFSTQPLDCQHARGNMLLPPGHPPSGQILSLSYLRTNLCLHAAQASFSTKRSQAHHYGPLVYAQNAEYFRQSAAATRPARCGCVPMLRRGASPAMPKQHGSKSDSRICKQVSWAQIAFFRSDIPRSWLDVDGDKQAHAQVLFPAPPQSMCLMIAKFSVCLRRPCGLANAHKLFLWTFTFRVYLFPLLRATRLSSHVAW